MQQSWRDDPDKCTFIVLLREICSDENEKDFVKRNLNAMAGDVNLFLSHEDDDEADTSLAPCKRQAELDIMIAEKVYQRNGLGKEASCLMMLYGAQHLGIRRFFCKINEDNHASRALFEKIGFRQCNYAECFRQVELELKCETPEQLMQHVKKICDVPLRTFVPLCSPS